MGVAVSRRMCMCYLARGLSKALLLPIVSGLLRIALWGSWPPQHAHAMAAVAHASAMAATTHIYHGRHNTHMPWPPQHAHAMAATAHAPRHVLVSTAQT